MLLALTSDGLLAIAALVTALGGLIATIAATRRARSEGKEEGDADCHERLLAARREAEDLAEELHRLKMREFE